MNHFSPNVRGQHQQSPLCIVTTAMWWSLGPDNYLHDPTLHSTPGRSYLGARIQVTRRTYQLTKTENIQRRIPVLKCQFLISMSLDWVMPGLSSSSAAQWSDPLACGHCGDQCQCTLSNVTQCDGYTTYHHLHLHLDTRQYLACICGSRMFRYKHLSPHALTPPL